MAEVAPAQTRDRLAAINQLTIVIGIPLARFVNWFLVRNLPRGATDEFIRGSWHGQEDWRWMFALTPLPAMLSFAGMFMVPESPRWLAKKGGHNVAKSVHGRISGEDYSATALTDIERELVG